MSSELASADQKMNEKTADRLHKRIHEKLTAGGVLEPEVNDKSFPGVDIKVRTRFHTVDGPEVLFGVLVYWKDNRTSSESEVWTDYKVKDGIPQLGLAGEEGHSIGHGEQHVRCQVRAQQLALMLEKSLKEAFES